MRIPLTPSDDVRLASWYCTVGVPGASTDPDELKEQARKLVEAVARPFDATFDSHWWHNESTVVLKVTVEVLRGPTGSIDWTEEIDDADA